MRFEMNVFSEAHSLSVRTAEHHVDSTAMTFHRDDKYDIGCWLHKYLWRLKKKAYLLKQWIILERPNESAELSFSSVFWCPQCVLHLLAYSLHLPATLSSDSLFPSSEYRVKSNESSVLMLPARSAKKVKSLASALYNHYLTKHSNTLNLFIRDDLWESSRLCVSQQATKDSQTSSLNWRSTTPYCNDIQRIG